MISAVSTPEPNAPEAENEENVKTQHPWLGLEPERFQLVRLSALPADREVGLRPLRFVSLGRVERHSKEEELSAFNGRRAVVKCSQRSKYAGSLG